MRHLLFALSLFLPMVPAFGAAAAPIASVTIPVQEYLDLRKNGELARVTSIEEVSLKGVFGKNLTLTVAGRCAGGFDPKDVLKTDERFSLVSCQGDALFETQGDGIRIVPLARKFRLSCELVPKNWNELELEIRNAFAFTGAVKGAEVLSEAVDSTRRRVMLTPTQTAIASRTTGPVSGSAKYHITVQPEGSTFRYVFRLNNPGRGAREYRLKWANGEIVQKVRGLASVEEGEKEATLRLSPGDNEVTVTGRFPSAKFHGLIESERQYLLVESHPTLQLTVEGAGRRISPTDPDLRATFPSARLYLFGKEGTFAWTTRKLEVLEATGFAVSSAFYRFYVPEFGGPIVEANFQVNNQGTPEISFDVPGTATYLEVNGEPQVLYKNTDGRLLAQMPPGSNSIALQYRPAETSGRILASHSTALVKPDAVLTNVNVQLLTPSRWKVLVGSSLVGIGSDFDTAALVFALLLGGLLFGISRVWRFPMRVSQGLAASGALLGFLSPSSLWLFAAFVLALTLYRYRLVVWRFLREKPLRTAVVLCFVGVPLILGALIATSSMIGSSRRMSKELVQSADYSRNRSDKKKAAPSFGNAVRAMDDMSEESVEAEAPGAEPSVGGGAPMDEGGTAQGFQGLPAKIDIPSDVNTTSFSQSMVDTKNSIKMRAWLVSQSLIGGLALLCFAIACWLLATRRKQIVTWTLGKPSKA